MRAPMPSTRPDRKRNLRMSVNESGFIVNPMAATIFFGLILTIVVYSALDITGTMT